LQSPFQVLIPGIIIQAKDKMEGWWHAFDARNERVVIIYNSTTIFYLYPSYSIINMEGILDCSPQVRCRPPLAK